MIIETHKEYVVLRSDSARFIREDGTSASMKFEVRLEHLQNIKMDGEIYILTHDNGRVEWINRADDDIIYRLEI